MTLTKSPLDVMLDGLIPRLSDLESKGYRIERDARGLVVRKIDDASEACGYVLRWNAEKHPDEVLVDRTGRDGNPNAYLDPDTPGTWVRIDDPEHVETVLRSLLTLP